MLLCLVSEGQRRGALRPLAERWWRQNDRKDEISEDFGKSGTKSIAMGLVAAPLRGKAEREGFVVSLKRSILNIPVSAAGSDGRRNTCLKFTRRGVEA